jgi:hypothetical protein
MSEVISSVSQEGMQFEATSNSNTNTGQAQYSSRRMYRDSSTNNMGKHSQFSTSISINTADFHIRTKMTGVHKKR